MAQAFPENYYHEKNEIWYFPGKPLDSSLHSRRFGTFREKPQKLASFCPSLSDTPCFVLPANIGLDAQDLVAMEIHKRTVQDCSRIVTRFRNFARRHTFGVIRGYVVKY
jgi:hypothetical protein